MSYSRKKMQNAIEKPAAFTAHFFAMLVIQPEGTAHSWTVASWSLGGSEAGNPAGTAGLHHHGVRFESLPSRARLTWPLPEGVVSYTQNTEKHNSKLVPQESTKTDRHKVSNKACFWGCYRCVHEDRAVQLHRQTFSLSPGPLHATPHQPQQG